MRIAVIGILLFVFGCARDSIVSLPEGRAIKKLAGVTIEYREGEPVVVITSDRDKTKQYCMPHRLK